LTIPQNKIGGLIGPGGKKYKKHSGNNRVKIDNRRRGTVFISGDDSSAVDNARNMVEGLTAEVEVGKIYKGKVTKIMAFGAFVEVLPGKRRFWSTFQSFQNTESQKLKST
jgi:polyribonucleotide nucleotidyltransferase